MEKCEKHEICPFFTAYENDKRNKIVLESLAKTYCLGNMKYDCKRRHISERLGGLKYVPINMMPNGIPMYGTKNTDWTKEVKKILKI